MCWISVLVGLAPQQHLVLQALKHLLHRQPKDPGSALGLLLGNTRSNRRIVSVSFMPSHQKIFLEHKEELGKTKILLPGHFPVPQWDGHCGQRAVPACPWD